MRLFIIISTWFLLVWSMHTDRQEYKPVYEIPDYEDFTIQEDNLPSSLISWLDNNQPNTTASKRQRLQQDDERRANAALSDVFGRLFDAFLHAGQASRLAAGERTHDNFAVKIFIRICRLRL